VFFFFFFFFGFFFFFLKFLCAVLRGFGVGFFCVFPIGWTRSEGQRGGGVLFLFVCFLMCGMFYFFLGVFSFFFFFFFVFNLFFNKLAGFILK